VSAIDVILERLPGAKQTGPERWIAKCPAHNDSSPSLSIRATQDGRVLLHCFAGCEVQDVLHAMILTYSALFDGPLARYLPPVQRGWSARELLELIAHEAIVASLVMHDALDRPLTDEERGRLVHASARISFALDFANGA
jgi:hypothetical protein